jgi:hypothetical protein
MVKHLEKYCDYCCFGSSVKHPGNIVITVTLNGCSVKNLEKDCHYCYFEGFDWECFLYSFSKHCGCYVHWYMYGGPQTLTYSSSLAPEYGDSRATSRIPTVLAGVRLQ